MYKNYYVFCCLLNFLLFSSCQKSKENSEKFSPNNSKETINNTKSDLNKLADMDSERFIMVQYKGSNGGSVKLKIAKRKLKIIASDLASLPYWKQKAIADLRMEKTKMLTPSSSLSQSLKESSPKERHKLILAWNLKVQPIIEELERKEKSVLRQKVAPSASSVQIRELLEEISKDQPTFKLSDIAILEDLLRSRTVDAKNQGGSLQSNREYIELHNLFEFLQKSYKSEASSFGIYNPKDPKSLRNF